MAAQAGTSLLLVPMTPIPELLLLPLMHQFEPVTEQLTLVTCCDGTLGDGGKGGERLPPQHRGR